MRKAIRKGIVIGMAAIMLMSTAAPANVQAATWKQNKTGWWWQEDNGSYPVSKWKSIKGKWYYFDQRGYMKTGWLKNNGAWYYLGAANDGAMKTGWQKIKGVWYYMDANGKMHTGWLKNNGVWYYLGAANDGVMKTGWQKVNGVWYYMDANGKMASDTWIGPYYVDASGKWIPNKKKEEGALESIQLDQKNASLWIGEDQTLAVIYNPADTTTDKSVKWSSSDESVATVVDGKVTGVGAGTTTITAEVAGKKATCEVNVVVKFSIGSIAYEELGYLPFGTQNAESYAGTFSTIPENGDLMQGETWSISDETVAKLEVFDDGYGGSYVNLTGLREGTTTLTATYSGKSVSLNIVTKKVADLEALSYPQEIYTRKVGEKFTLYPDMYPGNAFLVGGIHFSSSNPKVATIDGDVIRTKKEGYTTITAEYGGRGEISVSCTLKVEGNADDQELEKIQYEPENNDPIPLWVRTKLNVVVYPATYPYNPGDIKFTITKQNTDRYTGSARIEDGYIIGTSEGWVEIEASLEGCDPIYFDVRIWG